MAIDDDFPQILTDLSPGGEGTPGQAAREKDFSSLLQDMVLETSDVERFLADLARLTVDTLSSPGTEVFCGITLLRPNKAGTVASSSEKARGMDEIQYEFNEGPCLEAARTNRTVMVRDTGDDSRWREYLDALSESGLQSVLGVPIPLDGATRASLNIYAPGADAFTREMVHDAEEFARSASKSLRLAVRIAHLAESRENLQAAMASRATIDVAAGIIMAENRCSLDAAVGILKAAAHARGARIADVAAAVVASVREAEPGAPFDDRLGDDRLGED